MPDSARLLIPAALALMLGPPACKGSAPVDSADAASSASPTHAATAGATASQAPTGTAAHTVPTPTTVSGELPTSAPHGLDRRAECAKEGCMLAHLVPDEVRPALSDGAPMVVWEQVIGERSTVVFPRDEVVELEGVVLDGSVDVTPMEAQKATTVGGPWSAFRAPGGGVTLGGTGGKAARVALVVVVADPKAAGAGLAAHLDRRDKPGAPPGWAWKVRRKPVGTFSFESRGDLAWGGGAYHARIGWKAEDKPAAAIDLLRFSKDAAVAEHAHDHEWEILAVLEGDGELVRGPADKEERVPVHAGTLVTVAAGVRHADRPAGAAPLFAIQVYAPPGPEQRFRKLAGKAR